MMKFIFAFSFFIISAQSFAENTARILLEKDLIKTKKTMPNDVRVYNYFYLPTDLFYFSSEANRKKWASDYYMKPRAGNFWNPAFTDSDSTNYANGAGLYFAIDPSISKIYGNTFLEIVIPKGTPFLNVVSPIPLSSATRDALIKEGYTTSADQLRLFPKARGFYRDTLRVMVEPNLTQFRSLVQDIFEANKIQYIEYNFNTQLGQLCSTHSYSAFTLIGSKNEADLKNAILPEKVNSVSIYSTEVQLENISASEQVDKTRILKLRNMIEEMLTLKLNIKARSALANKYYPASQLQDLKTSLYSCDSVKK